MGPNAATADERGWRRFGVTFLGVFFGGLGLIYAALVVIDPYDTGRFPTFFKPSIAHDSKRMGDASRTSFQKSVRVFT